MAQQSRASYQLQPTDLGTDTREQIVALVRSFRVASERYHQTFRQNLPQWYDIWRGLTSGNFTPTKNNVRIPLIYATIWSDVARKVATAFSQWPILGFSGYGPDDMAAARKVEALVNAQFADSDILDKELLTFLSADLYGTAVSQLMWDHRAETRTQTFFHTLPLSQKTVRQMKRDTIITFDGPNYRPLDLLDFYPQPGFREINGNQGMARCAVRYYLDLDDCRFLASDDGHNIFDKAEVNRMAREDSVAAPRADEALMRRFDARTGTSPNRYSTDVSSRPVEIIEMWGTVPREFAKYFGGSTNVVITVANDQYLLRAVDNPFEHRLKPFVKYSPTPDPHYFYAPGKAEVAYHLQIAGNRFVNQQLDAADLLIHPMFAFNRQMGVNTRNLWAGPGRIFGVDGDPAQAIKPLMMDFRGLAVGSQMTSAMWQFIQMGSGVAEDTVMGLGGSGSDRQTAREFLGRREASGTRLMLESVIYDASYLEPLGNFFHSMNHQFLELPREVLVLGDSALNDPVTGGPIEDTRLDIDASVLDRQYAARAMGSTMALSRESEKANMLTLLQIVGGSPALAGSFNMVNFLRDLMRKMGMKNVNEMIQQAPQVGGMLDQQGMTANQMPSDTQGLLQLVGGGAPSSPGSGVPMMGGMQQ